MKRKSKTQGIGGPSKAEILQSVVKLPALKSWSDAVASGTERALLSSVTESAIPFVAAAASNALKQRLIFVCETVRQQELVHAEMINWIPQAHLLPQVDLPVIEGAIPDSDLMAERFDLLDRIAREKNGGPPVIVTATTLDDDVPAITSLRAVTRKVARDQTLELDRFLEDLTEAGYVRVPHVTGRGEYALRGGILDVFSWQQALPVRMEFFGDTVDSIREFDLHSQKSTQHVGRCEIMLGQPSGKFCKLREYFSRNDRLVAVGCDVDGAHAAIVTEGSAEPVFLEADTGSLQAGDFVIESASRKRLLDQLADWHAEKWQVIVLCATEADGERLREILLEARCKLEGVSFLDGTSNHGFLVPDAKLVVLSDARIFGRHRTVSVRQLERRRTAVASTRAQVDFSDLEDDALVVHLEHGIARYCGLTSIPLGEEGMQEVLELEFADDARLFVPLEHAHLVARYVGVGKRNPHLSKLGDARWGKAKQTAERAVYDYASSLLHLQAERDTSEGFSFGPDTEWQHEFEDAFPYSETRDQLRAIEESKMDMESERPMDRLICGDVGFGKTEVAIRAAFKAVMAGKQVAVLVPTTVLAQQHEQNFRERMSEFPVTIRGLSRFVKPADQRKTLEGLRDGSVDIVIGTHRLISKDVEFHNLGLVVVDEEQRFGVAQKEKFKSLFRLVDVLTLSATPIPRTLYLSLMGARDMSVIETPPANRLPVETMICPYDERIIRQAIERELERGGQVFFLHNRVMTIEHVAGRIRHLVPKAKVHIGHGQMDEADLEDVMHRFVNAKIDVLVSTTIIESGLDIPNANTIIIDRADRFGLADLYQLRGRVGRAQNKAYAYLLLPRDFISAGEAKKRIEAIRQYSSLGAGFKIAMRDLEIRGAGNILGTAQSGHIIAVGFDLYCQMLKQAVERLRSGKLNPRLSVAISLDFLVSNEGEYLSSAQDVEAALIPSTFMEDPATRIKAYKSLAEVSSMDDVEALAVEWKDRFGPLPEAVENLLSVSRIKILAAEKKIYSVECKDQKIMLKRGGEFVTSGGKFPRLTASGAKSSLIEIFDLLQNI